MNINLYLDTKLYQTVQSHEATLGHSATLIYFAFFAQRQIRTRMFNWAL